MRSGSVKCRQPGNEKLIMKEEFSTVNGSLYDIYIYKMVLYIVFPHNQGVVCQNTIAVMKKI